MPQKGTKSTKEKSVKPFVPWKDGSNRRRGCSDTTSRIASSRPDSCAARNEKRNVQTRLGIRNHSLYFYATKRHKKHKREISKTFCVLCAFLWLNIFVPLCGLTRSRSILPPDD